MSKNNHGQKRNTLSNYGIDLTTKMDLCSVYKEWCIFYIQWACLNLFV